MSKKQDPEENYEPKGAKSKDVNAIIDELIALLHVHMPSHAEAEVVAADINARLGREPAKEE